MTPSITALCGCALFFLFHRSSTMRALPVRQLFAEASMTQSVTIALLTKAPSTQTPSSRIKASGKAKATSDVPIVSQVSPRPYVHSKLYRNLNPLNTAGHFFCRSSKRLLFANHFLVIVTRCGWGQRWGPRTGRLVVQIPGPTRGFWPRNRPHRHTQAPTALTAPHCPE